MLWYNKSSTLYVTQTIQPQSNEKSYSDAVGRLFTASCLSNPNILDELWQKCTLPSATVNKFQKGRAGHVSQASWLLMDMKEQFRKHLSAFVSTHTSRQVSSGQTLTNLRLDTLSPWNMPVPKQRVTDRGLTLVQHAACAKSGGEKEVCVCDTRAYIFKMMHSGIKESVSVTHYKPDCTKWHGSVFCSQSDPVHLMDAWHFAISSQITQRCATALQ